MANTDGRVDREWDWSEVLRWCAHEARRVLGPGHAAEDAAQDAALRAWRRHQQCRSDVARRAWVGAIARNEALRIAGGGAREVPIDTVTEPVGAAAPDVEVAERVDLWRVLSGLGAEERRLLGLRYWADLTQAEAANRLGLPEGTTKVRLHRLRAELRVALA